MTVPGSGHAAAHNLADLVRSAAEQWGDRAALRFRGSTVSWTELDARVDRVVAGLRTLELADGDRVVIALPNGLDVPAVYFGVLRAGLVAVPANPQFTARELAHVLTDSGAVALVGGPNVLALAGEPPALVHRLEPARLDGEPETQPSVVRGGEDLAVLMYTSGTSGAPRGAMLSHRALLANLRQTSRIQPRVLAADDVMLLVIPLFHIYGLGAGLGQAVWEGATMVLAERFDPVDTLQLIADTGVTNVPGVPPMFVAWSLLPEFAEVFSSVRLAISGAAPLPPDAQRRLLEVTGHHVFEGYGLTEAAPGLTSTLLSEVPKPGSIGRPLPGVELKLLDPASGAEVGGADEDEEPDAGGGEPGEIVVRGENLFSGYWPDGADGPDPDGWWHTGDVAYADDDGDLFLVDRIKELVLVNGFNVYPREVEDVLAGHPAVGEVAVIGVPHPYTGETVKAFIVLVGGATVTEGDLVTFCEASLARFKCPTSIEFVAELPHSATGKVSKERLRAEATA